MRYSHPMTFTGSALIGLMAAVSLGAPRVLANLTKDELASVEIVDEVTIPTPGEFFTAMGRVGRPTWSAVVRTGAPATSDSRTLMALALGTLVADGYVAVEAQDEQSVKNIGKEILALAKKLNVSQNVLGRSNSINDFAENNNWDALREELEATQNEVKLDMATQNDDRLVTLVTLGAWLRGVDIVSGIVSAEYSPEAARLLRQPGIARHLIRLIDALSEAARHEAPLPALRTSLETVLPLIEPPTPSLEQTQKLRDTMRALDQTIVAAKP